VLNPENPSYHAESAKNKVSNQEQHHQDSDYRMIMTPRDARRVAQLRAKSEEYIERSKQNPHQPPEEQIDLICKSAILDKALTGCVFYDEIRQELEQEFGTKFSPKVFDNAWQVISDYVETGGENVSAGTGLPES
jgi:hypothetical protein